MSSRYSVEMSDEGNDSDGKYSEDNDNATREAFVKKIQDYKISFVTQ